jgi:hypothetical protein
MMIRKLMAFWTVRAMQISSSGVSVPGLGSGRRLESF